MIDELKIKEYTNKFTEGDDLYFVIIDNKIALLNRALILGYPSANRALKAFKAKLYWRIPKDYFTVSEYVNYLILNHRLKVMKLSDYKKMIKNS